jgi:excisionase family DNA binding protein
VYISKKSGVANMKTEFELEDIKAVSSTVVEMITPMIKSGGTAKSDDKIFSTADLAHYLQVHESWVNRKVALKEIPFFKAGKYNRFKKSVIDRWIDSETIKPIPPLKMVNKGR